MGRGSTVALATAVSAALLVSLPLLLVSLPATDTYDQETRRMFVEWKARVKETYRYAGEEECRYQVFKETRGDVSRARAARGVTSVSRLNGLAAIAHEEFNHFYVGGYRPLDEGEQSYERDRADEEEKSFEQEARREFVGWKARYGKTYRDAGEEECRYWLFKGNRRVVVRLNAAAAAAGQNVYGVNQFGDLTNDEVQERCYPEMMEDRELSARCQNDPDSGPGRLIRYQVCRCIATELKQTTGVFGLWSHPILHEMMHHEFIP